MSYQYALTPPVPMMFIPEVIPQVERHGFELVQVMPAGPMQLSKIAGPNGRDNVVPGAFVLARRSDLGEPLPQLDITIGG